MSMAEVMAALTDWVGEEIAKSAAKDATAKDPQLTIRQLTEAMSTQQARFERQVTELREAKADVERISRENRNRFELAERELRQENQLVLRKQEQINELRDTLRKKEAAYEKDLVRQSEAQDNRRLLGEVRAWVVNELGRRDVWSIASYTWLSELADLLGVEPSVPEPDESHAPVITLMCSDPLCDAERPLRPDPSGTVIPLSQLEGWSFLSVPGLTGGGWRCPEHPHT